MIGTASIHPQWLRRSRRVHVRDPSGVPLFAYHPNEMPDATRIRPRIAAAAAALAWVLGLYALPLVHNLHHQDDHTHGPAGLAEHRHPHEHPHSRGHGGRVPLDSDHGSGSVLHFAAAAIGAKTFELPAAGPKIPLPPPPSPRKAPSTPARIVLARGPPGDDSNRTA
jgi:hypothetical protein